MVLDVLALSYHNTKINPINPEKLSQPIVPLGYTLTHGRKNLGERQRCAEGVLTVLLTSAHRSNSRRFVARTGECVAGGPILRLQVWRPLREGRPVTPGILLPGASGDDCRLYTEAYRWHLFEDLWASVDAARAEAAREAFLSRFSPFRPPSERSMCHFSVALKLLKGLIEDGPPSWREALQPVVIRGEVDDDVTYRCNTIRAVASHLQWVHDIFLTVPLANVTIR